MADRVSASIVIGGSVTTSAYADLCALIADEGLSTEWDGELFEPHHRCAGEPLNLCAHDVAWGRFEQLEAWCVENKLAFARWSGGYGGSWGPERVVFLGFGSPRSYIADEEDRILIDRAMVEMLGSLEAVFAHFDAAGKAIPALEIVDGPQPSGSFAQG
ncbi:hypothetical protein [Sphingobium chungangianum]